MPELAPCFCRYCTRLIIHTPKWVVKDKDGDKPFCCKEHLQLWLKNRKDWEGADPQQRT